MLSLSSLEEGAVIQSVLAPYSSTKRRVSISSFSGIMLIYVSNPIAKATTSPPRCFPPPYFSLSLSLSLSLPGARMRCSLPSVRRLVPSSPSEHGSHYRFAGCCSAHAQEKNTTISPALSLQCIVNAKRETQKQRTNSSPSRRGTQEGTSRRMR